MRHERFTRNFSKVLCVAAASASTFLLSLTPAAQASGGHHHHVHLAHARLVHGSHVIQCVAFARSASEVVLPGNAVNWWQNAKGIYARGTAPEIGSVLSFRANRRMPLGHVAVVREVVDSRTILIDQSHWHANGIARDVAVIDISQDNDWSAVRVAIGHAGTYGSIYPTNGFIYPRPDSTGQVITASSDAALPATRNAAPSDLRASGTEVAEAPGAATTDLVADEGPNRGLR